MLFVRTVIVYRPSVRVYVHVYGVIVIRQTRSDISQQWAGDTSIRCYLHSRFNSSTGVEPNVPGILTNCDGQLVAMTTICIAPFVNVVQKSDFGLIIIFCICVFSLFL